MKDFEAPAICDYCGGLVKLTTTREIYRKSNEKIYLCTNCNAYVGCHKGTDRPLGKLANASLRMKRQETHEVFDRFWRERGWKRSAAYVWMRGKMSLPPDEAHIAHFDMAQCHKLIAVCREETAKEAA